MNIAEHVEFNELPTECKYLLMIAAMGASLSIGDRRRHSDDTLVSLASGFWNDSHLDQSDDW